MSKRRLSDQQQRRIKKNQAKKIADIDETQLGEKLEGLVITHYGQQVAIEPDGQPETLIRCYVRSNASALVAGDRVVWRKFNNSDEGVIEAILERRSLIERPQHLRGNKLIAANIDVLAIVFAAEPEPFENMIDRYIVAAHHANISPVLIFNKVDLAEECGINIQRFETYKQLGYPVLAVSAFNGDGIQALKDCLKDKTSIFVGQSGVGKSSLINLLMPEVDAKVGELSHAKAKGKHTTTAATLFHLPFGGHLIDSPGIREFGLWHLEPNDIAHGFIEFRPHLGQCKFRDCQHKQEKGCAILEAVAENKISQKRIDSYFAILQSMQQHHTQ